MLLYQVAIDQEHLPIQDTDAIPSLGKIAPDLNEPLLYLLIYVYFGDVDESTELASTVQSYSTRIYRLSLESGKYEGVIEVPQDGVRTEKVGTQEIEVPAPSFELLGVNSRDAFFLLRREEANLFQLLILDSRGGEVARRYIVMEDSELFFKEIRLSATGIIYALLGEEYQAKAVWWRSDRLVREGEREGS